MACCYRCKNDLALVRTPGREETCPHCGADLHVCLNCTFYSAGAYNDCREPQAERVVEKKRSNFCDYFIFIDDASRKAQVAKSDDPRSRLDALFKK